MNWPGPIKQDPLASWQFKARDLFNQNPTGWTHTSFSAMVLVETKNLPQELRPHMPPQGKPILKPRTEAAKCAPVQASHHKVRTASDTGQQQPQESGGLRHSSLDCTLATTIAGDLSKTDAACLIGTDR